MSSDSQPGKWVAKWFCANCNHPLSEHEKMYSSGTCPYCGYVSQSTVCNSLNKPVFVPEKPSIVSRFLRKLT